MKYILYSYSAEGDEVLEGMIIEEFLTRTASQLTYHGLCELSTTIQEEELCVFFRNNHFSTLYKHKGETLFYPLSGREWNSFREKIKFVPFWVITTCFCHQSRIFMRFFVDHFLSNEGLANVLRQVVFKLIDS